MSYILDALNRSEQERSNTKTPNLNTVHRAAPAVAKSNQNYLWIGALVVVLNVLGLVYFLNQSKPAPVIQPAPTQQPANQTSPQVTQAPATSVSSLADQNAAQAQSPNQPSSYDDTTISPVETPKPANRRAVRITELPINVQRRVPNMVFSSHLYSDESDFRMVNINGKMIREGDMVANEIRLVEITEEGVVLSYLHYVFEVSVLRDWSFN